MICRTKDMQTNIILYILSYLLLWAKSNINLFYSFFAQVVISTSAWKQFGTNLTYLVKFFPVWANQPIWVKSAKLPRTFVTCKAYSWRNSKEYLSVILRRQKYKRNIYNIDYYDTCYFIMCVIKTTFSRKQSQLALHTSCMSGLKRNQPDGLD